MLRTSAFLLSVLSATNAINLQKRTDGQPPKVVHHTIQRKHVADPVARDQKRWNNIQRRQSGDTVQADLDNEKTLYFMDMSIGTPPQDMKLHLDTGSSDLWVNIENSDLCSQSREYRELCDEAGTFSPDSSSTYELIEADGFNITYVDGSGASGPYVSDVVRFSNVDLQNQQFGIGEVSSSPEGILGIGYPINEVAVAYNGDEPYRNIPANLVSQNYINTMAYSLWLNDLDASTGSILFGGVNSAKYQDPLLTVPTIPERGYYAEFIIAMTGLGANGDSGSIASNIATPVLLDSGSSLMYLPNDLTEAIYTATNAQYEADYGAAYVDCSLANSDTTIDFTFSEPTIRVPMNELVIVAGIDRAGNPLCILGISPAGASTAVLGDTFLRSAYVVYDLNNNEISLAQTNFNATGTDEIQEISSTVPGASAVQAAVTDVSVESGGARIDQPDAIAGISGTVTLDAGVAKATAAPVWGAAAAAAAGLAFVI